MKIKKLLSILLITGLLSGCGTLFKNNIGSFHERSDHIDYSVLALDSMGLVFFIAPGLIAIGVDYITGNLYLSKDQLKHQEKERVPSTINDMIRN